MKTPNITTDLKKLKHNVTFLSEFVSTRGIEVTAVTKVFSAHRKIVEVMESIPEISWLADSRIENIKNYPTDTKKIKLLLRLPQLSEVNEVVHYADYSLNSQIEVIRALEQEASEQKKIHSIILMVDLGDLREGIFEESELISIVREVIQMKSIRLAGLGVNLTCYGAIIPTTDILQRLVDLKDRLENQFQIHLDILSGGNSSSLYLLDDKKKPLPAEINHLRIGEAFVLGVETAYGKPIPGMYQDVFTLNAEIIEYREKPSMPIGESGQDAFGEKPFFEDKGPMMRGILAIGRQDVNINGISPRDKRLEIVGSSSDHLIVDFTDAREDYKMGDHVSFDVSYGSLLACFTSKYVDKVFL